MIVLIFLVGLSGGIVVTRSTPKSYSATARLYVSFPPTATPQEAVSALQLRQDLLSSYTKVLQAETTTKLIAEAINHYLTPDQIKGRVSASVVVNTVLIDVKASDSKPGVTQAMADAAATALTKVIPELEPSKGGGISARVIDHAAFPRDPTAPQPQKDITVGAVFGLLAGLALALAVDSLDRTIKTPAHALASFGAPVLGSIPRERRISDDPLVASKGAGSPAAEAYRALRTSVRFRDMGRKLSTILVTSPAAGDGKTTVASNLAIAISQDGAKVILIDCDLRRTKLNDLFKLEEGPGLTSVLLGRTSLADALTKISGTLSVLQAGPSLVYPSEALGSTAMVALLKEASTVADVVILDAPPVLPVTDPVVLASLVDGTIMVCRWGRTSFHAAEATRLALEGTRGASEVVGVVLNAEGGGRSSNYYRHYSSRGSHVRRGYRNGKASAETPIDQAPTNGARTAAAVSEQEPS
jgi:receptor protein-tyrosine kinase